MINFELPRHFLLILCASLAVLLSLTFSLESWKWHLDWQLAHQTRHETPAHAKDESLSLIQALPEAHLFGQSISKGIVPITNLQLHVTGIVKVKGGGQKMSNQKLIFQLPAILAKFIKWEIIFLMGLRFMTLLLIPSY